MKIIFDEYETSREALPLAPANTQPIVKAGRRAGAVSLLPPRREAALFHAWRA